MVRPRVLGHAGPSNHTPAMSTAIERDIPVRVIANVGLDFGITRNGDGDGVRMEVGPESAVRVAHGAVAFFDESGLRWHFHSHSAAVAFCGDFTVFVFWAGGGEGVVGGLIGGHYYINIGDERQRGCAPTRGDVICALFYVIILKDLPDKTDYGYG